MPLQAVQGLACHVLVSILLPSWRAVQGADGSAPPAAVTVPSPSRTIQDGSVQFLISHVLSPTDILHYPLHSGIAPIERFCHRFGEGPSLTPIEQNRFNRCPEEPYLKTPR